MGCSSIVEFGAGVDNPLEAVREIIRIQKESHELRESVDLGIIQINEPKFWLLGMLSVSQGDGHRIRR